MIISLGMNKGGGGSGSGSTVSYTPIIVSGTQLGTITINGSATGIYAPESSGGSSKTVVLDDADVSGYTAEQLTEVKNLILSGYNVFIKRQIDNDYFYYYLYQADFREPQEGDTTRWLTFKNTNQAARLLILRYSWPDAQRQVEDESYNVNPSTAIVSEEPTSGAKDGALFTIAGNEEVSGLTGFHTSFGWLPRNQGWQIFTENCLSIRRVSDNVQVGQIFIEYSADSQEVNGFWSNNWGQWLAKDKWTTHSVDEGDIYIKLTSNNILYVAYTSGLTAVNGDYDSWTGVSAYFTTDSSVTIARTPDQTFIQVGSDGDNKWRPLISNNVTSSTVTTIWKGSQADYESLGSYSNNVLYIIV